MSATKIRHAAALVTAIAGLVLTPTGDASATQVVCGYHHVNPDQNEGAIAVYTHCADSFILIHIDNSNGHAYHRCVSPWSSVPFFRGDGVTNAYYVPITPETMVINGKRMCRLGQPPARVAATAL
ncbi:DUF6355 family natural product biosynthesis protein [Saccharothrix variisporea]|uniref:Peptidase inhibitor family I36 n=1 Tax=Saccharothrix variisporea TaxID=543527 RepID=A0A495X8A7_9PSEU|nr:DUF6355 family natural product biosynthesis protein [Saccharothrix variisporea]RKT69395.1 hypothetical protein DFJ66_2615 [Saccharothrix variisporea]